MDRGGRGRCGPDRIPSCSLDDKCRFADLKILSDVCCLVQVTTSVPAPDDVLPKGIGRFRHRAFAMSGVWLRLCWQCYAELLPAASVRGHKHLSWITIGACLRPSFLRDALSGGGSLCASIFAPIILTPSQSHFLSVTTYLTSFPAQHCDVLSGLSACRTADPLPGIAPSCCVRCPLRMQ